MEYTLLQADELELSISSQDDKVYEIVRNLGRDFNVEINRHLELPNPYESLTNFVTKIKLTFEDKCEMHYFEYLFLGMIENIEKLELCLAINTDEVQ